MPVHTQILENIHALLDFNRVPKEREGRAAYFSKLFNIPMEESQRFLQGEQVPNRKLLKEIADKFEVDPSWLLM